MNLDEEDGMDYEEAKQRVVIYFDKLAKNDIDVRNRIENVLRNHDLPVNPDATERYLNELKEASVEWRMLGRETGHDLPPLPNYTALHVKLVDDDEKLNLTLWEEIIDNLKTAMKVKSLEAPTPANRKALYSHMKKFEYFIGNAASEYNQLVGMIQSLELANDRLEQELREERLRTRKKRQLLGTCITCNGTEIKYKIEDTPFVVCSTKCGMEYLKIKDLK